jgi:glyoxylase-like metal-dependent hydrolase (beta-lactamase superfamily II)
MESTETFFYKELEIVRIKDEILDSNCYVIGAASGKAIVIDPNSTAELERTLKEKHFEVELIILTHEHYDHIAGVSKIKELTGAPLMCSTFCAKASQDIRLNHSKIFGVQLHFLGKDPSIRVEPYICPKADITFEKFYELRWGDHLFSMTLTPGHTEGSISIVLDKQIVFSGDSLIKNHEVLIRIRGGSLKQYQEITLPFYEALPQDCLVCAGHGEVFRLSEKLGEGSKG